MSSTFGYRGHHLDLRLKEASQGSPEYVRFGGLRFEVQVRTVVQHAWTVLQNKLVYKRTASRLARRKIAALAAVFETVDGDYLELRKQMLVDADTAAGSAAGSAKGDEATLLAAVKELNDIQKLFRRPRGRGL